MAKVEKRRNSFQAPVVFVYNILCSLRTDEVRAFRYLAVLSIESLDVADVTGRKEPVVNTRVNHFLILEIRTYLDMF